MYLPKDQLEVGRRYRCDARNFTEGLWTGEAFAYERTKFGVTFWDREYHWDDDKYGTVKPLEKLK